MSITDSGLYAVDITSAVKTLSKSYITLIKSSIPFRNFPSVMLWGPPGVGKSQGVREIAANIAAVTKKKVEITDVRLLLFNPVDLRGIPTANADKTLAVWLKPKIFQMNEDSDTVNILFLDEISAASPSVQAAAYQITLDRTVGEHCLPENCIIIAAGNRATDKSVAYTMPSALANRLCHIEIKSDITAWHNWAVKKEIHEYVVGYIEYNSAALMKPESPGIQLAFPTPRSWEMVSNILKNISENMDEVYTMIIGCIGHSAASTFRTWTELYTSMPSVENIFLGEDFTAPKEPELLIALRSVMVAYARNHPEKELIDNSVNFACKLPWQFKNKLLHDYYCTPILRPLIKENEIFMTAVKEGLR